MAYSNQFKRNQNDCKPCCKINFVKFLGVSDQYGTWKSYQINYQFSFQTEHQSSTCIMK